MLGAASNPVNGTRAKSARCSTVLPLTHLSLRPAEIVLEFLRDL